MRFVLFIIALQESIGGLGLADFTETVGWSFTWLLYLVLWLPLTETFSLAVLLSLAQWRSLRWYAAAGIVGTVALLQCFTLFGGC